MGGQADGGEPEVQLVGVVGKISMSSGVTCTPPVGEALSTTA